MWILIKVSFDLLYTTRPHPPGALLWRVSLVLDRCLKTVPRAISMKQGWKINVGNSTFFHCAYLQTFLALQNLSLFISLSLVKGFRENKTNKHLKRRFLPKSPSKRWEHPLPDRHIHIPWWLLMTACQASLSTVITSLSKRELWKLCFTVTLNYLFSPLSCFPTHQNTITWISCCYFLFGSGYI